MADKNISELQTAAGTNNVVFSAEWARKAFNNRFRPTS